ncbi:MAG: riboflavin biosynthesis protein RibF [Candidatus Omnitrophica bacterium]|nr:riboflavin biosynthesis protein RibF [Candidatus Omnitrophota bacterium]
MKIILRLKDIKKFKDPVVAIGVFDGLHIAHQRILNEAKKQALRINGKSLVLTFWPHPKRRFSIYSLAHRLRLISELGIDACVVIKFDKAFSRMSPGDFIKKILAQRIGARFIYVGENFRFGRNAAGSVETLEEFSGLYGFKLKVFKPMRSGGRKISSTYIRELIISGKLDKARRLLLRPVSVFGKVIKGTGLARRLGFPTANIRPHHEILPPPGIYAVRVLLDGPALNGACYIGIRPTFKAQNLPAKPGKRGPQNNIEVHIFDFNKNIYGSLLEIQFIKKIRNERQFSSPELLIEQIRKDIKSARGILLH